MSYLAAGAGDSWCWLQQHLCASHRASEMGGDLAEEMYNKVEKGAGELQGFRKALLDQP